MSGGLLISSHRRAFRASLFLLGALIAAVFVLLSPAPTGAQSGDTLLVSNLGSSTGTAPDLNTVEWAAVEFTTGSNTTGYTLSSVSLDGDSAQTTVPLTVTLRDDGSDGPSSTVLATFTNPSSWIDGVNVFTLSTPYELQPDTDYWVHTDASASILAHTGNTLLDSGSKSGWSIDRMCTSRGCLGANPLAMALRGTVVSTGPVVSIRARSATAIHWDKDKADGADYPDAAEFIVTVDEAPTEHLTIWLGWEEAERGLVELPDNWAAKDRYLRIIIRAGETEVDEWHILFDRYDGDGDGDRSTGPPLQTLTYFIATDRDDGDPQNKEQSDPDYNLDPAASKACVTVTVPTTDNTRPGCTDLLGPRPQTLTVDIGAPSLYANAVSTTQVDLVWSLPEFGVATGYDIQWSTDNETWQAVSPPDDGGDTIYSHTGLTPDTTYYYRVRYLTGGSPGDWSHPVAATTAPVPENNPATGAPTITGAPRVGGTLTADTSGIADADGLDAAVFAYQWSADGSDITGATESEYTLTDAEDGTSISVTVSFTDDAGNEESLTSAATEMVTQPAPKSTPKTRSLTASVSNVPSSHDGESAFTFELRFSEEFPVSYKTLRDHAFEVTGGRVTKAKRLEQGSDIGWRITVRPDSSSDVTIVLPETTDCDGQGAICTEDGRMLSTRLELTVSGPGG